MFRQLATNAGASIKKGDRVVITGRLKIRPWINADGRTGTSVEIDADTAGHDLMWGTANFRRTTPDRPESNQAGGSGDDPAGDAVDGLPDGVDSVTGEVFDPAAGVDAETGTEGAAEQGVAGQPSPGAEVDGALEPQSKQGRGSKSERVEEPVPF